MRIYPHFFRRNLYFVVFIKIATKIRILDNKIWELFKKEKLYK